MAHLRSELDLARRELKQLRTENCHLKLHLQRVRMERDSLKLGDARGGPGPSPQTARPVNLKVESTGKAYFLSKKECLKAALGYFPSR